MTDTPRREEIHNELLRAERSLQAAQLLLKERLLEDTLSPGRIMRFCMRHGPRC